MFEMPFAVLWNADMAATCICSEEGNLLVCGSHKRILLLESDNAPEPNRRAASTYWHTRCMYWVVLYSEMCPGLMDRNPQSSRFMLEGANTKANVTCLRVSNLSVLLRQLEPLKAVLEPIVLLTISGP